MKGEPVVCYICAQPIASEDHTDEHVFPENLFNPGDRVDLIKLPAHRACNASYSKDDEYFRLCMTSAAYEEPRAKRLWTGPVLRSVHRPQSAKYKSYIQGSLHDVEVRSRAVIILGNATVMMQDSLRIQRVVHRMARGLHTHLTGDMLPSDWSVSCDLIKPSMRAAPELACIYEVNRARAIGNWTVHYVPTYHPNDHRDAMFWIVFYDSIDFWAFVGDKTHRLILGEEGTV